MTAYAPLALALAALTGWHQVRRSAISSTVGAAARVRLIDFNHLDQSSFG
jgi:hypothetical protein